MQTDYGLLVWYCPEPGVILYYYQPEPDPLVQPEPVPVPVPEFEPEPVAPFEFEFEFVKPEPAPEPWEFHRTRLYYFWHHYIAPNMKTSPGPFIVPLPPVPVWE